MHMHVISEINFLKSTYRNNSRKQHSLTEGDSSPVLWFNHLGCGRYYSRLQKKWKEITLVTVRKKGKAKLNRNVRERKKIVLVMTLFYNY